MIRDATALLPVRDINAACAFMRDCLGFETTYRSDGYAYCESGQGAVRFINAPPDADMHDPARQIVIYLDCDDVDTLWATHQAEIVKLPDGHYRAPFDRPYNQREFHVIHGPFLFMAGQAIEDGASGP
ncbi:VOC family protein [Hasllibacter sp. MH4015]|uniref:VOC family protein n=1 Tax=Hasllibacter sp. MH4015 TaxID=2854029 RepID=UPI001CD33FAB|nr:VOC family protein [Hasllibacter sp. MH4015]